MADYKPVLQEVIGTVVLPPLEFPALAFVNKSETLADLDRSPKAGKKVLWLWHLDELIGRRPQRIEGLEDGQVDGGAVQGQVGYRRPTDGPPKNETMVRREKGTAGPLFNLPERGRGGDEVGARRGRGRNISYFFVT